MRTPMHRAAALSALLTLTASMLVLAGNTPASAAAAYKILITGDSITQGSSGDYTWRYRLWDKLQTTAPGNVEFVGTRTDLYDNVNDTFGSQRYAAGFAGKAHAAKWGSTYWQELANINNQVTSSGANTLIVMLGSNDLSFATSPAQTIDNVRTYIQTARAAKPGIDVVVGEVVNKYDPWTGLYYLNTEGADYATRLRTLASQLNTASERVVVAPTRTGWDAKDHTWDGTHPNPTGEALIAQRISQGLAAIGIGTSSPNISGTKAWNVTAPGIGLTTAGHEAARLSWNRTSTGATGMYIEVRLTTINEPWNRLPYAIGGEGWTAELLAAGGTYQFRVVPAKGFNTGLHGPASTVTATGPQPGNIVNVSATAGGDDPNYGGKTAAVTWSKSTNASGYYLASRKMHNGAMVWDNLPYPITDTNWTFGVLYPGWRYRFGIKPIRGFLEGTRKASPTTRMKGLAGDRTYAILGDSYSSGVGAHHGDDDGYYSAACRRSRSAWGMQVHPSLIPDDQRYLRACQGNKVPDVQGAQLTDVTNWFTNAFPGKNQLITVTIGGNDVGFGDLIRRCYLSPPDCTDQEPLAASLINQMPSALASLYSQIKAAHPYADIMAVTYPSPLHAGTGGGLPCQPLGVPERYMADRLTRNLNSRIVQAAQSAGIWASGDARTAFAGHGACGPDSWINGPLLQGLGADIDSFHPNAGGQFHYAVLVSDSLIARSGS